MTEGTSRGFGATLRDARLAAGKELEDLAAVTRISKRHLEALEEENWSALPEGVIGRGFVRLVARELVLPEKEILAQYQEARGEEGPAKRRVPPEVEWKVDFRKDRGPRPVLFMLVFLVGAALGIWVWSPWSVDIAPPPGEQPSTVAPDATSLPAGAPDTAAEAPVAGGGEAVVEEEGPVAEEGEQAPASAPELPADLTSPPSAPEPAPASPAAVVEGHRLEILAVEKVWVRTAVDGERHRDRLLEPGKRETLEVRKTATLRLGNAGGVRLSWDGEALKVPGAAGQVLTLTLPGALERLRP